MIREPFFSPQRDLPLLQGLTDEDYGNIEDWATALGETVKVDLLQHVPPPILIISWLRLRESPPL